MMSEEEFEAEMKKTEDAMKEALGEMKCEMTTVASEMSMEGMTVDACKAIEPAIKTGIAEGAGVGVDTVDITGYTATGEGRRLAAGVDVAFEIVLPGGSDSDVAKKITEAVKELPVEEVVKTIVEEVKKAPELQKALETAAPEVTIEKLEEVKAVVKAPTVKEGTSDEKFPPKDVSPDSNARVAFVGLVMLAGIA